MAFCMWTIAILLTSFNYAVGTISMRYEYLLDDKEVFNTYQMSTIYGRMDLSPEVQQTCSEEATRLGRTRCCVKLTAIPFWEVNQAEYVHAQTNTYCSSEGSSNSDVSSIPYAMTVELSSDAGETTPQLLLMQCQYFDAPAEDTLLQRGQSKLLLVTGAIMEFDFKLVAAASNMDYGREAQAPTAAPAQHDTAGSHTPGHQQAAESGVSPDHSIASTQRLHASFYTYRGDQLLDPIMRRCTHKCYSWYTPSCWDMESAMVSQVIRAVLPHRVISANHLAGQGVMEPSWSLILAMAQQQLTQQYTHLTPAFMQQQPTAVKLAVIGIGIVLTLLLGCQCLIIALRVVAGHVGRQQSAVHRAAVQDRAAQGTERNTWQNVHQHMDQDKVTARQASDVNTYGSTYYSTQPSGPTGMFETPSRSGWQSSCDGAYPPVSRYDNISRAMQFDTRGAGAGLIPLGPGSASRRLSLNRTPPGTEMKAWGRDANGRLIRHDEPGPPWMTSVDDSHQLRLYPQGY